MALVAQRSLEVLEVLISPNIGKHFALPYTGSAAKPCVLSDCSIGPRGSRQMARGEWLKGGPQSGIWVNPEDRARIHTRPQVG